MAGRQDAEFMRAAYEQALESYNEGGLPIGAVMVENGTIIAAGHNRRVQDGDPIAHGEMDCFRRAGRRPRYDTVVLYTTLSPCMMCSGTIVQFGVKRVVIGEARNFPGNPEFLRAHGVDVDVLDDTRCIDLMERFKQERPAVWDEDIAGRTSVDPSRSPQAGADEIAKTLSALTGIFKDESHKSLFDYLYNCLSILDDKSSSLLSFNSIIMAVFAIFMSGMTGVTAMQEWAIALGTVTVLASSLLLLWVVHIEWSTSKELEAIVDHERNLMKIRGTRTAVYKVARRLAVAAVLGLGAFFALRFVGW